jgi:outer membrane protein
MLVAAATLLDATGVAAQGLKIGYVNVARIEKESPAATRGLESLKQAFEPRVVEIRELQKRIAAAQSLLDREREKLATADAQARERELTDMMRQSDQMVLRYSEEFEQRRNQLRATFIQELRAAIKTVGDAEKFDLILQDAVFARPAIDITDQVLKTMAK